MKKQLTEKEMIDYLMTYPDHIPSPQAKARTIQRIQEKSIKNQARLSTNLDPLFITLFVSFFLLFFTYTFFPIPIGEFARQMMEPRLIQFLPGYCWLVILLCPPLLLCVLPFAKGGQR